MKNYLLTYAVFFQSIILPYSSLKKYRSNHALFFGELYEKDKSINSIPTSMCTDYIKGARPVREELVHKMCKERTPEELISHIDLLGIQDLSAVFDTLKKLLHIVELSESLRNELLEKLEKTDNKELFLVEVFRLSLQMPNTKCELTKEDMTFLNDLASIDITEILKPEPGQESDNITKTTSTNNETIELSASSDPLYDEIDRLLAESSKTSFFTNSFGGRTTILQEVNLPADFDSLVRYVGPFINDLSLINIDFADFRCVCNLDLDNKVCRDGSIFIFETTCNPENLDSLKEVLYHLPKCNDCLLMVTADLEIDLTTFENISSTVYEHLSIDDGMLVYALKASEEYDSTLAKLRLVCHITEREETSAKVETGSQEAFNNFAAYQLGKSIMEANSFDNVVNKDSMEENEFYIKVPDIFKRK